MGKTMRNNDFIIQMFGGKELGFIFHLQFRGKFGFSIVLLQHNADMHCSK